MLVRLQSLSHRCYLLGGAAHAAEQDVQGNSESHTAQSHGADNENLSEPQTNDQKIAKQ